MRWIGRALAVLALPLFAAAQPAPSRSVPAREAPVPDTVSPELRDTIASPLPPALTVSTLVRARDARLPVPAAVFLGTPVPT